MLRYAAMKLVNLPTSCTAFVRTGAASASAGAKNLSTVSFPFCRLAAPLSQHGFASLPVQQSRTTSSNAVEYAQAAPVIHEVTWEANRANSISMIGTLGRNPETKVLPSGKTVTTMTLACKRGKNDTGTDWYDVDAWDDLGTLAEQNLQKGSRVLVEGRLKQDQWTDKATGQQRSRAKIVAFNLARVRPYESGQATSYGGGSTSYSGALPAASPQGEWTQPGGQQPPPGGEWLSGDQTIDAYGAVEASQASYSQEAQPFTSSKDKYDALWEQFFSDKTKYWDNRDTKKGRQPDFKHKDTGEGLWLSSAPAWVESQLNSPDEAPF